MPTLQIRNLPVEIYEALMVRAKAQRRSLAQQAVVELEKMPELRARSRRLAVIREIRQRLRQADLRSDLPAPEDLLREDRER